MTLTWAGGSGNWTDENWSGAGDTSRRLAGNGTYTVTMASSIGSIVPVIISDPVAVLQMMGGAWCLGAMTLMAGTLTILPYSGADRSLPTALTTLENVGGSVRVPTLASLEVKDGFINAGQLIVGGNVLIAGSADENSGTIAIDQGTVRLGTGAGLAGATRLTNVGTITLAHGGVLDDSYASIVATGSPGTIRFLDESGAILRIGDGTFGSVIDSFQVSDVIDLVAVHYETGTVASYAGGVLNVYSQSSLVTSLRMSNIQDGATFSVAADGAGGTRITTDNRPLAVVDPGTPPGTSTTPGGTDTVARTAAHFVDNSLEAQAGRLYNASFGRAPDESGLDYWSATLHDGVPLDGIAGLFLTSAEFQARYGSPGTTSFVNALYQNVLARGADTGGLTYWRGQLDGGALTRAQVLASFSESAENKAATPASANAEAAARLYYATLDRAPDADGLAFWTSQLSAGTATLTQEADSLAGSAEFVATYSNLGDVAFVRVLYQNVLGRAADAGGIASWSNALAAGASRGSVVTGFSESGEMKARFAAVIGQDGIVVA